MGLTLCCGSRENAGGRNEMGVSTIAEVMWEAWEVRGLSVAPPEGAEERGMAVV